MEAKYINLLLEEIRTLRMEVSELKTLIGSPKEWVSMSEAQELMRVKSRTAVYDRVAAGLIGKSKIGRSVVFSRSDINRLIQNNYSINNGR